MANIINNYGDKFVPAGQGRGVDISSQRQDELDQLSLDFVLKQKAAGHSVNAVDVGGGLGVHAVRLAAAGAQVTLVDISDAALESFKDAVENKKIPAENLTLLQKDFSLLSESDFPEDIDLIYSQRAIHYVPYATAHQVLSVLFNRLRQNGMIFISAAGFDTEYGKTFPDRDKPVHERFNYIAPEMQEKHGINHKIATYTQEDLALLLEKSGFSNIKTTVSEFGNIKACAQKP